MQRARRGACRTVLTHADRQKPTFWLSPRDRPRLQVAVVRRRSATSRKGPADSGQITRPNRQDWGGTTIAPVSNSGSMAPRARPRWVDPRRRGNARGDQPGTEPPVTVGQAFWSDSASNARGMIAPHAHARASNFFRLMSLTWPRRYSMMSAACNCPAASVIDSRRTPSNFPICCCVMATSSPDIRSKERDRNRHRRCSIEW
jgi:hypothetical protein